MKYLKVIIIVLLLVIAGMGVYLGYLYFSSPETKLANLESAKSYTGTIKCLPTKPGYTLPPDEGCVKGFFTDSGLVLYLVFMDSYPDGITEGAKIRIEGGELDTTAVTPYEIDGKLRVSSGDVEFL